MPLQCAIILARRFIWNVVNESTPSIDSTINELFGLSLLVYTRARAGYIGWVKQDGQKFGLQLREIQLHLTPGEAKMENVTIKININCSRGTRLREMQSQRHMIQCFERNENAILNPVTLLITMLRRRGILNGSIDEILARAERDLIRRIQIGTPDDAEAPVLLRLTKDASYNDHGLCAASSENLVPVCTINCSARSR